MVGAARPLARTFDVPLPGPEVFDDVQRLVRNLIAMNAILRDREHCSMRLVMNPDRMVIKEAQRTFTYLNLYGYLTDAVIVNRVFPDDVEGGYFGALARAPARAPADRAARGSRRAGAGARATSTRRSSAPAMLDRLAAELFADGLAPQEVLHAELAQELSMEAAPLCCSLPIPFTEKAEIGLQEGRRRAGRRRRRREADYHPALRVVRPSDPPSPASRTGR